MKNCIIVPPSEVKQSPHTALKVLNDGIIIADQTSAGILQRMLPPMPVIRNGRELIPIHLENPEKVNKFWKHRFVLRNYNLSVIGKKIEETKDWSSEVSWRLARLTN